MNKLVIILMLTISLLGTHSNNATEPDLITEEVLMDTLGVDSMVDKTKELDSLLYELNRIKNAVKKK